MTLKSFIIAAATGLTLLAALPASAHHAATPKAQSFNQNRSSHADRQIIPLRMIFRILGQRDNRQWRRGHNRRYYRHDQRRRYYRRHSNRRYY